MQRTVWIPQQTPKVNATVKTLEGLVSKITGKFEHCTLLDLSITFDNDDKTFKKSCLENRLGSLYRKEREIFSIKLKI